MIFLLWISLLHFFLTVFDGTSLLIMYTSLIALMVYLELLWTGEEYRLEEAYLQEKNILIIFSRP